MYQFDLWDLLKHDQYQRSSPTPTDPKHLKYLPMLNDDHTNNPVIYLWKLKTRRRYYYKIQNHAMTKHQHQSDPTSNYGYHAGHSGLRLSDLIWWM